MQTNSKTILNANLAVILPELSPAAQREIACVLKNRQMTMKAARINAGISKKRAAAVAVIDIKKRIREKQREEKQRKALEKDIRQLLEEAFKITSARRLIDLLVYVRNWNKAEGGRLTMNDELIMTLRVDTTTTGKEIVNGKNQKKSKRKQT